MFFYDEMLKNDSITYRLMGRKFKVDGLINESGYIKEGTEVSADTESEDTLILKDFIKDPLQISVVHTWKGGDAGLAGAFGNVAAYLNQASSRFAGSKDVAISVAESIANFSQSDANMSPNANRQHIAASDYYKVYGGTTVHIPLSLNCRLITRVDSNNRLISPKDQLKHILGYFMGPTMMSDNKTNMSTWAPHGYHVLGTKLSDFKDGGTLTLYWGSTVTIKDLILTDFSVVMSKEKRLEGDPLFIDINFSLAPAMLFTQGDVMKIVSGESNYEFKDKFLEVTYKEEKVSPEEEVIDEDS